jgi:hypothetical protein
MVLRLCALAFLAMGCLIYGGSGAALAGDYDGGYGQSGDEAGPDATDQPDAADDGDDSLPDDAGDAPDDAAPDEDQPE